MMNCNKPWVEKYRPQELNDVVLDALNKSVLQSILDNNHFPNLLLHGPPGTGKTTTVVSLIKAYQQRYNQQNKGLMIHLNASDERGIDIIRNQIHQFVNAKSMYCEGLKFVILDEVDYMTKNAQQALKYLLQACVGNVRFCLICNYISRIDDSLQNEFVRMRFNQLPSKDIISFFSEFLYKLIIIIVVVIIAGICMYNLVTNQMSSVVIYFLAFSCKKTLNAIPTCLLTSILKLLLK